MNASMLSLSVHIPDLNQSYEIAANHRMEASSVIKLFIVTICMKSMQERGITLDSTIDVKASHIRNTEYWWCDPQWEPGEKSFRDIIKSCLSKSDAVATNVLIDFLDGKTKINKILHDMKFMNTALMRDSFSGTSHRKKYVVARTSANDCKHLLFLLSIEKSILSPTHYAFMKKCMREAPLHTQTWRRKKTSFCHKTGTSQNGKYLTINDIGIVYDKNDKLIVLFVLLTKQAFSGKYYGKAYFEKLESFDKNVIKKIDRYSKPSSDKRIAK